MRSWRDREDLVEARGAEYRAGQMTEAQFRAYLFSMRYRGEDLRHRMNDFTPPEPPASFEEHRMEASRRWLAAYRGRK